MTETDKGRALQRALERAEAIQAITYDCIGRRLTVIVSGYVFAAVLDNNADGQGWCDLIERICALTGAPIPTTLWDMEDV